MKHFTLYSAIEHLANLAGDALVYVYYDSDTTNIVIHDLSKEVLTNESVKQYELISAGDPQKFFMWLANIIHKQFN